MTAPTRAMVRAWLRQLAADEISRTEAAEFARPWVGEREREVINEALWSPLARLAGADLETAPSEYLYDGWDFERWLNEFELAAGCDNLPPS